MILAFAMPSTLLGIQVAQLLSCARNSASVYRRSEHVGIEAVVISELKLRDVERHVWHSSSAMRRHKKTAATRLPATSIYPPSWPGLSRPSTTCFLRGLQTWMPQQVRARRGKKNRQRR